MKTIRRKNEEYGYFKDCVLIKNKAKQFGYNITLDQAEYLWRCVSGIRDAGWLVMPNFDTKQQVEEYNKTKKHLYEYYNYIIWEEVFNDDYLEHLGFYIEEDLAEYKGETE